MSRRKSIGEVQGDFNAETKLIRAKQEAKVFELGIPATPEYLWNDRKLYALWKQNAKWLFDAKKLAFSDGDALLEMCKALAREDHALAKAIADATWANRKPFADPHPESAAITLPDFLKAVAQERATFGKRMRPNLTVCLDSTGAEYTWPDGDAAAVARRYALELTQEAVVAGDLMKRAAARFLAALETGHEKGLYFDPLAARHIVRFAEQFCGLQLLPWETWILVSIFAFKKPSGARVVTEAWVSCAKKNGKTALASCVGLWMLVCDQEQFPDVFSAATKKEQARLVWRDGKRAVLANPELNQYVQRWAGALSVKETDGTWTPLSSDEKSMDGLRPSGILADECAFWADREQWDKLVKGVVSRVQPLVFAVTTAGSTKNCFAWGKFDLAEKILRGVYDAPETFVAIYAIDSTDDPMNEVCWPKANPSLNSPILKIEHLRKTRDEVLQDPSGLNSWLQYHCNIWPEKTLQRAGSIPVAKWAACSQRELIGANSPLDACVKFMELNRDLRCYAGLDVGMTSDTSFFTALWPVARFAEGQEPIEKRVVIAQCFMPEAGLLEKEKAWQVPLSTWAREGWISLCPGDLQDPKEIRKFILDFCSRFFVGELGFDNWNAQVLAADLNESGAIRCVSVPQTAKELTTPCRELLAAIHSMSLVHFGNPVLAWQASNVVFTESEKHGGTKPEKLSYAEKIDGISALCNAWHRLLAAPPPSPYLKRGIVFI